MKNGWPQLPLGDALHRRECDVPVNAAESYQFAGVYCFGRGVFRGQEKLGNQFAYQRLTRLRSGDFVYPKLMAWEGAFGIVPDFCNGCVVSPEFPVFELNRELISPQFLNFYFQIPRVWEEVSGGSTGTNVRRRRLHPDNFLRAKIPMPPLAEQRRLVARIEELAAQIHEARILRHQAAEEAELLPRARARARLSGLPEPMSHLSNYLDPSREGIQTGPFGAQLSNTEFTEAGVPLLTIGNIQYSGLDSTELKFVSLNKAQQLSRYRVREGDILFARMGTVGRCCVVPKQADSWLINYHIIRVALNIERVEPRFVHWTIQSSADVEAFLNDKIRGATREGVNSKIVAALPCRIPPLPEQLRIVAELEALQTEVDALKRLQVETAAELDALLPAILDRAFKGEL